MSSRLGRARTWVLVAAGGLLAVLAGLLVLTSAYKWQPTRSPTMAPTLAVADLGLYAPVSGPEQLRRGDIVTFTPAWPEAQGFGDLVFRVVGVEGDTVACCTGDQLLLNGAPLVEPYVVAYVGEAPTPFTTTVPPGRVFLAGDSRSLANDSRRHLDLDGGTVATQAVTGRLVGVLWPLRHWGFHDAGGRGPSPGFAAGSGLIAVGLLGTLAALGWAVRALVTRRARRTAPEW